MFYGSAPLFLVSNLHKSVDYYCDVLGFERPHIWGDPPFFAMPRREDFIVMLQEEENKGVRNNLGAWDAYFWVKDAGKLFKEFEANGVSVLYPPELKEAYGCYEFAIKDPDDYILAFGQEVDLHPFYETNPLNKDN